MRTLRNLPVTPALIKNTGFEASVGDTVRLYLDQLSVPTFPEYVNGTILEPITKSPCRGTTFYNIQYDESEVSGETLRVCDVIETVVNDCYTRMDERVTVIEGQLATVDHILELLGVTTYADLTAANTALDPGVIFFNTALAKLDITTA